MSADIHATCISARARSDVVYVAIRRAQLQQTRALTHRPPCFGSFESRRQDGDEVCLLTILRVGGAGFDRSCAASCCVGQEVQFAINWGSAPSKSAVCRVYAPTRVSRDEQLLLPYRGYPFTRKHRLLKHVSLCGKRGLRRLMAAFPYC